MCRFRCPRSLYSMTSFSVIWTVHPKVVQSASERSIKPLETRRSNLVDALSVSLFSSVTFSTSLSAAVAHRLPNVAAFRTITRWNYRQKETIVRPYTRVSELRLLCRQRVRARLPHKMWLHYDAISAWGSRIKRRWSVLTAQNDKQASEKS